MRIKSFEANVRRQVFGLLGNNLDDAAKLLADEIKKAISIPGPPRSTPGNPPHIDQGDLIASYDHVTDKAALQSFVGSDEEHAVYMELGTDRVAARPHVLPTLMDKADDIAREMTKP